ncbi:alpha-amylase-like protein, partial [Prunus dulcis]
YSRTAILTLYSGIAARLYSSLAKLIAIRSRNEIKPNSALRILASDADLYVAAIDEKIIAKVGSRYDVGNPVPPTYQIATSGKDYAVWEKKVVYHLWNEQRASASISNSPSLAIGWDNRLQCFPDPISATSGITHVWLPPPSHAISPEGIYLSENSFLNLVSCANHILFEVVKLKDDRRTSTQVRDKTLIQKIYSILESLGNHDTRADYNAAPDTDHKNTKTETGFSGWNSRISFMTTSLTGIQERDLICLTDSAFRILSADADVYVASIDEKIIVKIGPRLDICLTFGS